MNEIDRRKNFKTFLLTRNQLLLLLRWTTKSGDETLYRDYLHPEPTYSHIRPGFFVASPLHLSLSVLSSNIPVSFLCVIDLPRQMCKFPDLLQRFIRAQGLRFPFRYPWNFSLGKKKLSLLKMIMIRKTFIEMFFLRT